MRLYRSTSSTSWRVTRLSSANSICSTGFRSRRDSAAMKPSSVVAVDLGAEARRRDERERQRAAGAAQRHAARRRGRRSSGRRGAARSSSSASRNSPTASTRKSTSPRPDVLVDEPPWPGQVGAIDRAALGQRAEGEQPVLGSPPNPCSSSTASSPSPCTRYAQRARAHRRRSPTARPAGSSSLSSGTNVSWNSCHEGVDLGVRGTSASARPRRGARRPGSARPRAATCRRRTPATGRLDRAVDLVGLDLRHLVAHGDLDALVDQPARRAGPRSSTGPTSACPSLAMSSVSRRLAPCRR